MKQWIEQWIERFKVTDRKYQAGLVGLVMFGVIMIVSGFRYGVFTGLLFMAVVVAAGLLFYAFVVDE